jgi:hypothetical protein
MSSDKSNDDLSKTKMCVYFKVGCKNPKCQFAHSKEELKPTFCRFGNSCRKDDCWFVHPEDEIPTTEELFQYCLLREYFREVYNIKNPQQLSNDLQDEKDNIENAESPTCNQKSVNHN